jgi:aryl-alcohol dehydrogenase-like predicted oxidoreductase
MLRVSKIKSAKSSTVMRRIVIPGAGIETTRLGFGCSQLMGGITREQSLRLLEAAFDSGIRHFDTAPMYGYGEAEGVLGEAFRSQRHHITITTKYGIRPPRNPGLVDIARRLARPLVQSLPALKSYTSRAASHLASRARFSRDELRTSLETSLKKLQTDYIDVFLLHEAGRVDLTDELFAELEQSVREGKIRTFGIGSEASLLTEIYPIERRFCQVVQCEWSVLSAPKASYKESFIITHRSLSSSLIRLHAALKAKPQIAKSWSAALNLDLTNPSALSKLMIAAALNANPDGIVLFSSRKVANIAANSKLLGADAMISLGAELARLVAQDAPAILSAAAH